MSAEYVWNSFREVDGQLCDGERKTEGAVIQQTGLLIWVDLAWSLSLSHPHMEMGPSLYYKLEKKRMF